MVLAAFALAACDTGGSPRDASRSGSVLELAIPASGRIVDRDVPAPQVFDLTEPGLWDGRPSLGGVWVAHPTARDPERVVIRNTQTGAEVIGALFRRERENPGPRFQISSEAAGALGILAGQPATISVIALRVERIETRPATPAAPVADATTATDLRTPPTGTADAATLAPDATGAETSPRRGLRDLFARQSPAGPDALAEPRSAAAPAAPTPPAPVTVAALGPAAAGPTGGGATDRVDIIALDPEPPAPRRGLRDMFRREPAAAPAETGITQTALAPAAPLAPSTPLAPVLAVATPTGPSVPAAPLASTPMLGGTTGPGAFEAEPVLMAAVPERRGLRDMFRRQPAAAPAPDGATLIPLPDLQPAAAPARDPVAVSPAVSVPPAPQGPVAGQPARPYVQIGIFSVEANANRARAQMRAAGLPAEVRAGRAGETAFWRVVIGPAPDAATHADHLRRARGAGFTDAYAVAR